MALAFSMELNVVTSGAMWPVGRRQVIQYHELVLVQDQGVNHLRHTLETITTVNQAIQQIPTTTIGSILMIHYGMASSVKVPAAMVPTLPHGSVYSFLLPQLKWLKCVFVAMKVLIEKIFHLNLLRYMCNRQCRRVYIGT